MRLLVILFLSLTTLSHQSFSTSVLQMNLEEMTPRADTIFRGTLIDVEGASISFGGGNIPILTYKYRVDEVFKGQVNTVKGVQIAEVKMLGTLDKQRAGKRIIESFPLYAIGEDYLMFVAPAGITGLTTTMGLGQGSFHIYSAGKQEMAVNEHNNINIFAAPNTQQRSVQSAAAGTGNDEGPISYRALADHIKTLTAQ